MNYNEDENEYTEDFNFDVEMEEVDTFMNLLNESYISFKEIDDVKKLMPFDIGTNMEFAQDTLNKLYQSIKKIIEERSYKNQNVFYCRYIHEIEDIVKRLNIEKKEQKDLSLLDIAAFEKKETRLDSFNEEEAESISEFINIKLDIANKMLVLLRKYKIIDFNERPFHLPYKDIDIVELAIIAVQMHYKKYITTKDFIDRICDIFRFPIIDNADELIEEVENRKNRFPLGRLLLHVIKKQRLAKMKKKIRFSLGK